MMWMCVQTWSHELNSVNRNKYGFHLHQYCSSSFYCSRLSAHVTVLRSLKVQLAPEMHMLVWWRLSGGVGVGGSGWEWVGMRWEWGGIEEQRAAGLHTMLCRLAPVSKRSGGPFPLPPALSVNPSAKSTLTKCQELPTLDCECRQKIRTGIDSVWCIITITFVLPSVWLCVWECTCVCVGTCVHVFV